MWLLYLLFYGSALFVGVLIVASMLRSIGIGRRLEDVHSDAPEYQGVSDEWLGRWGLRRKPRG